MEEEKILENEGEEKETVGDADNMKSEGRSEKSAEKTNVESLEKGSKSRTASIKRLESEIQELKDKYIRIAAEYDNFRKRTAKERENIFTDAYISAIKTILPVYDNVERAIAEPCVDEAYKKGVELIMKQLNSVFEKMEITEVPGVGEPFNPEYHNAVMHVEDGDLDENVVAEVFQKGFIIRERVLRHAMVKVAN